jgi:hypothetical protein
MFDPYRRHDCCMSKWGWARLKDERLNFFYLRSSLGVIWGSFIQAGRFDLVEIHSNSKHLDQKLSEQALVRATPVEWQSSHVPQIVKECQVWKAERMYPDNIVKGAGWSQNLSLTWLISAITRQRLFILSPIRKQRRDEQPPGSQATVRPMLNNRSSDREY